MATVLIRGIDDRLKMKLRLRAAEHGVSMEQEARTILDQHLNAPGASSDDHPVRSMRAYVEKHGGWDGIDFRRVHTKARVPEFD